jgi:hypothetical protein
MAIEAINVGVNGAQWRRRNRRREEEAAAGIAEAQLWLKSEENSWLAENEEAR